MKKNILVGIAVAAVIALGVFLMTPVAIVPNADACTLHRVDVIVAGERLDVTEQVDLERLRDLLTGYRCSRVPLGGGSYSMADVAVEMDGMRDGKPMHIILGNLNVVYESAQQGWHAIRNGQALLGEVLALIAAG